VRKEKTKGESCFPGEEGAKEKKQLSFCYSSRFTGGKGRRKSGENTFGKEEKKEETAGPVKGVFRANILVFLRRKGKGEARRRSHVGRGEMKPL